MIPVILRVEFRDDSKYFQPIGAIDKDFFYPVSVSTTNPAQKEIKWLTKP